LIDALEKGLGEAVIACNAAIVTEMQAVEAETIKA